MESNHQKTVPAAAMSNLCECGCGGILIKSKTDNDYPSRPIRRFVRGHNRRNAIFTKAHRKRISRAKRGIKRSLQARKKQGETRIRRGIINSEASKIGKSSQPRQQQVRRA
jgi:hypothetical protein